MKKDLFAILIITVVAAVFISTAKFQTVDDYYLSHIDDITQTSQTVFISIRCDRILDSINELPKSLQADGLLPLDGMILNKTEYVLRPNDTVFSVLDRVVRYNRIQMEYSGSHDNDVYIKGINYLYEFYSGPLSGWIYKVNGVAPDYSCSRYKLEDGDIIEWEYTK